MDSRFLKSGLSRRRFVGLALTTMAASLLTACGGGARQILSSFDSRARPHLMAPPVIPATKRSRKNV
jgi:hypothetical protein